mgnify:FL=1
MASVPSNAAAEPFARAADGTVAVGLPAPARDVLASMLASLTAVITDPDADTDPAVRALFPNPHPDDRDRQADWVAYAKPGLLRDRLEAIGTVEATLSRDTITDGEAYTWMTVLNSLRLVLAARLGIADRPEPADDADSGTIGLYQTYWALGDLVARLVERAAETVPDATAA